MAAGLFAPRSMTSLIVMMVLGSLPPSRYLILVFPLFYPPNPINFLSLGSFSICLQPFTFSHLLLHPSFRLIIFLCQMMYRVCWGADHVEELLSYGNRDGDVRGMSEDFSLDGIFLNFTCRQEYDIFICVI